MEATGIVTGLPHNLCGTFVFDSSGKKTLRLMYEMATSGSFKTVTNSVAAGALGTLGSRDINWEVTREVY